MGAAVEWILKKPEQLLARVAESGKLLGKHIGHVARRFGISRQHDANEHIRIGWVGVFKRHLSSPSSRVPIVPTVPIVAAPTSFLPRAAGEDEGGGWNIWNA